MSKRSADNISTNCSTISTHLTNHSASHFIVQTFLGPLCTKCHVKVSSNSVLFCSSWKTIIRHWTKNKCYEGNISQLNAAKLERSLNISISNLYNSMTQNPHIAKQVVNNQFTPISNTKHLPYCSRCGYVGKLANVKRHVKSMYSNCSESDLILSGGDILYDKHNFAIPRNLLNTIAAGKFSPTITMHAETIIETNPSINDSISSLSSPSLSRYSNTTESTPSRFVPSAADIDAICSPQSPFDDSISMNAFAMSELVETFGDENHAQLAREYLTSFIHLLQRQTPGRLRCTLLEYGNMMKSINSDPNLQLFIDAGIKWLTTNSANMDVRMVPVHHRNLIYLVGHSFSDADKDLHKGCTFSWVEECDNYSAVYQKLVTFIYSFRRPFIQPYLDKVSDVYTMVLEDDNVSNNLEQLQERVIAKLVDSNIIHGFLAEIIFDEPSIPNGPNIMYHYLSAALIKTTSNRVSLRYANSISKHANAILRILRYGLCSLYVRKSFLMARMNQSDREFQSWAQDIISGMHCCPSVGHVCRTLRTARQVDSKTPSSILKSFDDLTGEILVAGTTIHKSVWSTAIPSAIAEWDKHLMCLFPNHSSSSKLPLHWIFDLNNSIILADTDSSISIHSNCDSSIPLTEFQPTLP